MDCAETKSKVVKKKRPGLPLPVLLTEKMEFALEHVVQTAHDILLSTKLLILQDIARGLEYLHIIPLPSRETLHSNVTSSHVFLTMGMRAKIADFGMAYYIVEARRSTPPINWNIGYVAPEAYNAVGAKYQAVDMFSFGHLSLNITLQEFRLDILPSTYCDHSGTIFARTETERRGKYFKKLTDVVGDVKHPLVMLIKQCLENTPENDLLQHKLLKSLWKLGS